MMSALTLLSRCTGFVRTWAMAFALGNTVLAAGYSLANNLPNMIYELVAGGFLSAAFLPIYMATRAKRSEEEANAYACSLLSIVVVALGAIALVASIFAPQVIATQSLFSSSSHETVQLATWFFRFFAFQIVFYGMSAVFQGLLNAQREFFWPAISSVFMNIVTIATFFGYPFVAAAGTAAGITWLGCGTTLSIAVMAAVQIPALVRTGFRFRFNLRLQTDGLRETVSLALPAIACTAINLVAISLMNSCALHVAENGPSSVSYAWMWYQFPYGVLGVALSTALFTEMSDATARSDWEGFKGHFLSGLSLTWVLIIPLALTVGLAAPQLIGLYTAGSFTADNVGTIAGLLRCWCVALPLYAGYMFVYRAYSSMKDLRTVAACNFVLTFVQVGLYVLLTGAAGESAASGLNLGLRGLAVADTVFYALMLAALLVILRRRVGGLQVKALAGTLLRVLAACALTAAAMLPWSGFVTRLFAETTMLTSFLQLAAIGAPTLVLSFALATLFGVNELRKLANALASRLRR